MGLSTEQVIACGDSMNDLSLFQTGCRSIAVGNSEAALIALLPSMKNVFHSQHIGVLGIIDGLQQLGFIQTETP